MNQKLAQVFHIGSWVLLASLVTQFFFAGVMLFGVAGLGSKPHLIMALFIHGLSFVLFLAAVGGRLGRPAIMFTALFFVLMFVQGGLMQLGRISTVFMALHPANATLLLYVAYRLAKLQPQPQASVSVKENIATKQIKVMV